MKSIYEFNKGDEIVRIEPCKPTKSFFGHSMQDRSYIGDKMEFVGIANGMIYLKPLNGLKYLADSVKVSVDLWAEGWNYWVDPNSLLESVLDKDQMKTQLDKAIKDENYELAAKLQKLLK